MSNSLLSITSEVESLVIRDNIVVQRTVGKNTVVNTGLDYMLSQLVGLTTGTAIYMALGSNSTATLATDGTSGSTYPNGLHGEYTGGSNVRLLCTTTPITPGKMLLVARWTELQNQNNSVAEIGLYTALTGGIFIARYVQPTALQKDQFSQLQINYTIQITS